MLLRDTLAFAFNAVRAQRQRSVLTALGIAVGIAAVVLLTSLGTGLKLFAISEFTQFGTNLLSVDPGRATTAGLPGAMINSVRPLTIGDATALQHVSHVEAVSAKVMGNAEVKAPDHSRRTNVAGVGAEALQVWRLRVAAGTFLPPDDPEAARPFAVLGSTLQHELFGARNPLGEIIHIGGMRFRVVGVMESKGQVVGFDLDDAVYIPAARCLELFNREGLMGIDVLFAEGSSPDAVKADVERLLTGRHGSLDFTATTQQQMLDVLGTVLSVLTLGVAALGSISLLVGGIGILTIMTIALRERTGEIGLLRALGATRAQLTGLFLGEAAALAAMGGIFGLLAGIGIARLLNLLVPALPVATTVFHAMLAELVAVAVGLVAGVLPALRAARLDPIEALRAE